jgi:uncharacterized protein (TIRG00374 family)
MAPFLQALKRHWTSLAGGGIGLVLIVVVFFVVLPSIADPRDIWGAVQQLSWPWLLVLAGTAALNVLTFAPPYQAALPGLRFRPALAVTTASTASTYIAPGGPAVGMGLAFAMLRGWGFRGRPVTIAVTLTTIWNQFVIFGTPVLALAWLTWAGGSNPLLSTIALVGLIIFGAIVIGFGLALSSARQAKRLGNVVAKLVSHALAVIRKAPVTWSGSSFVRFRADTIGLLRRRWYWLTLSTMAGHITVYFVLLASLRAVGVRGGEVNLAESFAAWSLARVLGSIPLTPGGLGVIEIGLAGALVAFGGPQAEVVAAILIYRFLTIAPPVLLGAIFGATWRRHNPDVVIKAES